MAKKFVVLSGLDNPEVRRAYWAEAALLPASELCSTNKEMQGQKPQIAPVLLIGLPVIGGMLV